MAHKHKSKKDRLRVIAQAIINENRAFSAVRKKIDRFANLHPDFDALAPKINKKIQQGCSLEEAYRRVKRKV